MRNQLRDVKVRRVSFVDRAAVRDPEAPEQARTFLLLKADDSIPTRKDDMATATTSLGEAITRAMSDHPDEVASDMKDRLNRIASLAEERRQHAKPTLAFGDANTGRTAEEVRAASLMTLHKAERSLPAHDRQSRLQLRKAGQRAQLELLRERNPRGAEIYERDHPELSAA